ncbi:MAG TPA: chorismate-binding protein [Sporichthya sp.]|nr:chorismate-binding protein [Sporichthya sp.]
MDAGDEPLFSGGGLLARGLLDLTDDPAALDSSGFWAVLATFEGALTCARFADVRPGAPEPAPWVGPRREDWTSSLERARYVGAVEAIRSRIAAGEVYQANLCRILSAPLPDPDRANMAGLAALLAAGNPAPYAAVLRLPDARVSVAGASPELFLRRSGRVVESGPIKGTAREIRDLQDKDRAENVMIVDLVRNDLGRVCATGSVTVPSLCAVEAHPGLVHLVSTVRGELRPDAGWADLLAATFPPGSVTGAPKLAALGVIADYEPAARGPYCGALGWVDAEAGTGCLAVSIRTFWREDDVLRFGTGAGITWASDPAAEWAETELKAERLVALASTPPTSASALAPVLADASVGVGDPV